VDRPQACRGKPPLQPVGRRLDGDVFEERVGKAAAMLGRGDLNLLIGARHEREVGQSRLLNLLAQDRGQLAGDAQHREGRSEEHTSELQSRENLVCRLLLEKKKKEITPTNGNET